jgi:hypothetical protein
MTAIVRMVAMQVGHLDPFLPLSRRFGMIRGATTTAPGEPRDKGSTFQWLEGQA